MPEEGLLLEFIGAEPEEPLETLMRAAMAMLVPAVLCVPNGV
jgi:hypothetical protein